MKTLRVSLLPLLIASGFFFQGCATDIVGKAEQATHIAAINLDTFLKFERTNEAQLIAINPGIHAFATKLRHKECASCDQNGIRWLKSARALTEAYRLNRTPENKVQLETIMALLQETLNQITDYFLDPHVAALDPQTAATYSRKHK